LAAAAALAVASVTALPAAAEGQILGAGRSDAIKDSYLVMIKDSASPRSAAHDTAQALVNQYGGKINAVWQDAVNGFAVTMTDKQARRLAADPRIVHVEQDATVSLAATQSPVPSWGLDRIDQRALPLNNSYTYPNEGSGVTAYVIDTGIRTTHTTFGGRAVWGTNTTGDGNNTDCNGHGTHVAGTIGGSQYGVAKSVRLVAVKVLSCAGSGSFTGIVSGVVLQLRHVHRHLRPRRGHHVLVEHQRHRDQHDQRHVDGDPARGRRRGPDPGCQPVDVAGDGGLDHVRERHHGRHHQPGRRLAEPPAVRRRRLAAAARLRARDQRHERQHPGLPGPGRDQLDHHRELQRQRVLGQHDRGAHHPHLDR
jgi:hypothetical protein